MRRFRLGLLLALALMLLPVGAAVAASSRTATGPGTVSGTITDIVTHTPVNAVVTAYTADGSQWDYFDSTDTDASGHYSITLDPGKYRISAAAEYSPETFYKEGSNGVTDVSLASTVAVTAGGSKTVDIAIPVVAQDGTVTGHVTSGGSPLAGVQVSAVGFDNYYNATTDANGSYSITDLPEGPYQVLFVDPSGACASQWNGGALWEDRAATVTLGPDPVACDAAMSLGGTIHGSLSVAPALTGTEPYGEGNCQVTVFRQDGADWTEMDPNIVTPVYNSTDTDGDGEKDQQDGTYTIAGVPAGDYRVRFGGTDVCGRFYGGAGTSVAATDPADPACKSIEVSGGSRYDLGTASLVESGRIRVKVVDHWGTPIETGVDVLRAGNDPDPWDTAWVQHGWTEGSDALIGGLLNVSTSWLPTTTTGAYRVYVYPDSDGLVPQWYSGKSTYGSATSINVVDGQATSITVTLKYVLPFASLNTPSAPASVKHSASFTVSGTVKPKQKSGSKTIKLYFYRSVSGVWKLGKTVTVKVSNYKTYSKYSAKVSLSSKGKWRVRAYHVDSKHAPTYSSWRSITVK